MSEPVVLDIAAFLHRKYRERVKATPDAADLYTMKQFAADIGVDYNALNAIYNRRQGTAATQAGIDQDEAKAADLLAALERVRGISPEATRLLEQELADTQARLAHRQRELSDAERAAAQYHRAELRAAMLDLAHSLASLDNPDPAVRADTARLIARALPALTVKHGQILP